jgi:hypothetical protein
MPKSFKRSAKEPVLAQAGAHNSCRFKGESVFAFGTTLGALLAWLRMINGSDLRKFCAPTEESSPVASQNTELEKRQ